MHGIFDSISVSNRVENSVKDYNNIGNNVESKGQILLLFTNTNVSEILFEIEKVRVTGKLFKIRELF